jgi:hypothetical protein
MKRTFRKGRFREELYTLKHSKVFRVPSIELRAALLFIVVNNSIEDYQFIDLNFFPLKIGKNRWRDPIDSQGVLFAFHCENGSEGVEMVVKVDLNVLDCSFGTIKAFRRSLCGTIKAV